MTDMKRPETESERRSPERQEMRFESQRRELLLESMRSTEHRPAFSEPPTLALGDPYHDPLTNIGPKLKGPRFCTSVPKKGQIGEGCFFSAPIPLCVGDPYIDPTVRLKRLNGKKKTITEKPFIPSGPPSRRDDTKALTTSALVYEKGLDKKEVKKIIQQEKSSPRKRELNFAPRNILTNPVKCGHYGVAGTLLADKSEITRTALQYASNPYDVQRELRVMEMKKERQLQGDRKPFLPPSYGSKTFEPDTNTYRRPVTAPEMSRPKTAKSETPPFRPTSPPKRGINATIGQYPSYLPEPVAAPVYKRQESDKKPWVPPTIPKRRPISSIALNKRNLGWRG